MSQKQAVLNYLRKHGSIDDDVAYNKLRIRRLPARIYDLRKEHDIITIPKKISKRTIVAVYKFAS